MKGGLDVGWRGVIHVHSAGSCGFEGGRAVKDTLNSDRSVGDVILANLKCGCGKVRATFLRQCEAHHMLYLS
jgi:hypothetical protein